LYHDPRLLVMDEATAALDHETEQEIIQAINAVRANRTVIMIAHRLTTIQGCDRIYMLANGIILDHGSYSELRLRHSHLRLSDAREIPHISFA
jgi:ATP-binding cassette subfamily C protein